jgi:hypothetical protein
MERSSFEDVFIALNQKHIIGTQPSLRVNYKKQKGYFLVVIICIENFGAQKTIFKPHRNIDQVCAKISFTSSLMLSNPKREPINSKPIKKNIVNLCVTPCNK